MEHRLCAWVVFNLVNNSARSALSSHIRDGETEALSGKATQSTLVAPGLKPRASGPTAAALSMLRLVCRGRQHFRQPGLGPTDPWWLLGGPAMPGAHAHESSRGMPPGGPGCGCAHLAVRLSASS